MREEQKPAAVAPVVAFEDPRVQKVYELLCSEERPPQGEHWEGFVARRIVDALAAPAAVAVPDGWKLVPVEPTGDMCGAGTGWGTALSTWQATLAAAPQPPVAVQEPVGDLLHKAVKHSRDKYKLATSRAAFQDGVMFSQRLVKACSYDTHPAPQPAPVAQGDALDAAFEAVRRRLCGIQRYSFMLDDDGVVRRVQDRTGNWIEFDAAHELFDPVAVDSARAKAKEGASNEP